jgi:hypothetical protein
MPAANSLHGGTQPEAGTTVFSSTGTTPESLRMDCVGHAAQALVPAGQSETLRHAALFQRIRPPSLLLVARRWAGHARPLHRAIVKGQDTLWVRRPRAAWSPAAREEIIQSRH